MSDPSSSLKNCVLGWRSKRVQKSKSSSDGINNYVNGVVEIEAADIKDGLSLNIQD